MNRERQVTELYGAFDSISDPDAYLHVIDGDTDD
jgi:hypothetical protein